MVNSDAELTMEMKKGESWLVEREGIGVAEVQV
jgi:hypothetical protein